MHEPVYAIQGFGPVGETEWRQNRPQELHTLIWAHPSGGLLYQGGTHDLDTVGSRAVGRPKAITKINFDACVTLYGPANPAGAYVVEYRFPILDGELLPDTVQEIEHLSNELVRRVADGQRVISKCQAGLNRSGLITGLVLIKLGFTAEDAINLIRERRSRFALCNHAYVAYLHSTEAEQNLLAC